MKKYCVLVSIYKNDKLEHVKEALQSLYFQTLKADIFIKIDGEIDKELENFLLYEYEEHRIEYLNKRNINKGLAISLNELINKGLERKYEYFFRMDADDISICQRFEKQIEFLEKNKNIDICGTFIEEFGNNYKKVVKYPLTHNEMFEFFKKRPPLAHVSVCFRKSFFEKAGFYLEDGHITNEDTLMWLKGFQHGCRFSNISTIGVKVRIDDNFFNRRRNIKKVGYDFKNRLEVNKTLRFGINAYLYSLGIMIINLLPPILKKVAYRYLR